MKKIILLFLAPLLAMAAPTQPITNGIVPNGGTIVVQSGGSISATGTGSIVATSAPPSITLSKVVTSTGHGLSVGTLYGMWNSTGTTWVKASASSTGLGKITGIAQPIDANTFTLVEGGDITTTGLTAGAVYYLTDDGSGLLTTTAPTTTTSFVVPVLTTGSTTLAVVECGQAASLTKIGTNDIASSITLTTPNIGAATATSLTIGTPGYTDIGVSGQFTGNTNSYYQMVLQNTNAGAAASTDFVVSNNSGTATTFYGNFGINSSAFTGTGSYNLANATYLSATSGDLSIGTTTSNGIHFFVNTGATDAMAISSAGAVTVNAPTTITGPAASTALTIAQTARTSGVLPYIKYTIPTDTAQTAATESPGIQGVTGTRTWATTGTVALQREIYFPGATYASASASQTFTDIFNMYLDKPIAGTNAIFTRGHTLGIVDSTSAASSITGGLVVATTLGTTATSVGIGGGNVNAGGLITGGTVTSTGALTAGATSITGAAGTTALTVAQTARTSGVLPYVKWTIPTDTGLTAATESPGFQTVTGTRTWATTGTVALQRENLFVAPTYASASASQTFTKAATLDISGPPIAGTNAIITQGFALNVESGNSSFAGMIQHGGLNRTTAGFTATSNTTLTNITALTENVLAGQNYHFRVWAPTTATTAGGIQFAIAGTCTATNITYEGYIDGATKTRASALAAAVCSSATATTGTATIEGTIQVNAAGTLTVQFAQNTTNASASTVLQGATFEVWQVSN